MRAAEIANRLTGFGTPFFGVQWTPATLDRDIAQELIVFLEDRRVLYSPYEAEVPEYVVSSVFEIRRFLTDMLRRGQVADELHDNLRAMPVACRTFIDRAAKRDGPRLIVPAPSEILQGGSQSWVFKQLLGQPRGVFGVHLALIAVRYRIDIPDELATILPLDSDADDGDEPRSIEPGPQGDRSPHWWLRCVDCDRNLPLRSPVCCAGNDARDSASLLEDTLGGHARILQGGGRRRRDSCRFGRTNRCFSWGSAGPRVRPHVDRAAFDDRAAVAALAHGQAVRTKSRSRTRLNRAWR